MTALATTTTLQEMNDRHGVLTNPLAVFGTTPSLANEPVPPWLDDRHEVRWRLARKHDSGLGAETWQLVAELTEHCGALLRPRFPPVPLPRPSLDGALATARELTRRLPKPPRSVLAHRSPMDSDEGAAWWRTEGTIEAATGQLCRAIDDPGWTDPDALAGWITDAATALDDLRRSARLPNPARSERPSRTGQMRESDPARPRDATLSADPPAVRRTRARRAPQRRRLPFRPDGR